MYIFVSPVSDTASYLVMKLSKIRALKAYKI